jgi:hypothetical protein
MPPAVPALTPASGAPDAVRSAAKPRIYNLTFLQLSFIIKHRATRTTERLPLMKPSTENITSPNLMVRNRAKFWCNNCKTETIQKLSSMHNVKHYEGSYDANDLWDDNPPYFEECQYRFWICEGCETACLQKVILSSTDVKSNDEILGSVFYPSRNSSNSKADNRIITKEYYSIPKKIQLGYREAAAAYNSGLYIACAVILRALLEAICIEKGITDLVAWGLEKKIEQLEAQKILPENVATCLNSFKFMGDQAAHDLEIADQAELRLALEVMEDILNSLYEVDYRLSQNAQRLADMRRSDLAKQRKRREKRDKP